MKRPGLVYLVIATLALLAAIMVPLALYRSGTPSLPAWGAAVSPGPLSKAHAFLNGKCESCHVPSHGVTAAKCVTCHAFSPELLSKPATAFHADVGDCRGCHVEHQAAQGRPIRMDHEVLQGIADRRTGHAVPLDCQSCHATRDKHQGLFGSDCASCHATTSWKIAGFLHPSPKSTSCSECHKAPPSHYMMHFEMMDRTISGQRGARVEQCFMCHQTDSFNNIKGVGMVKVH